MYKYLVKGSNTYYWEVYKTLFDRRDKLVMV